MDGEASAPGLAPLVAQSVRKRKRVWRTVLRGEIFLAQAKELGRDRGPDDTDQPSGGHEEDRTGPRSASAVGTYCLCGCGEITCGGRFKPGHDAKLRSELVAQIRKGDVLMRSDRITAEQRAFAVRHGLIAKETLPEEEREG